MAMPTADAWEGTADPGDPEPDVSSGVWCEHGSARAVIRGALGGAVASLVEELPRAREGEDPEGVHQARVATRRIRSDLRTFTPLLDEAWCNELRSELAWLADSLGGVRDLDVLADGLTAAAPDAGAEPGGLAMILDEVTSRREAARSALIRDLDDPRATTLLDALHAAAEDPPTTGNALGHADIRLRPLVRSPWRKLVRVADGLGDEPEIADLHRVRLLAKRTRYAAEAVAEVFGRPARRFVKAVTDVQGTLGEMNDAEVASDYLRSVAGSLPPDGAFAAGRLAHHFDVAAERSRHGWERSYDRARRRSDWLD